MENTILTTFQNLINDILMLKDISNDDEILNYYDNILNMEHLSLNECEIIDNFLNKVNTYSELIINEDDTIFNNEILPNVNFLEFINKEENTIVKKNIWKYLQTFNIISININSSQELKALMSGSTNANKPRKKDVNDLKRIKQLKKNILKNEEDIECETESDNINDGIENMNNIFKNTNIGNLAEDIASNIDVDSIMKDINTDNPDPTQLLQSIMKPENFSGLFNSINTMVQSKIDNDEIDTEKMHNEANNLFSNFEKNPIMKDIINNEQLQKMKNDLNNDVSRDLKKEKLRKKIEAKEKQREKK